MELEIHVVYSRWTTFFMKRNALTSERAYFIDINFTAHPIPPIKCPNLGKNTDF